MSYKDWPRNTSSYKDLSSLLMLELMNSSRVYNSLALCKTWVICMWSTVH